MTDQRDRESHDGNILSEVFPRLIPKERLNEKLVHDKFLDLFVTYGVPLSPIDGNEDIIAWGMLTREAVEKFGFTVDQIRRSAMDNLRSGTRAETFNQIAERMIPFFEADDLEFLEESPGLLYLTVDGCASGAAAMMDGNLLRRLAKQASADLYIIPSSQYEVIAVPDSNMDAEGVSTIHREVQLMEVQPNERLSDQVYLYRRKYHRIEIVGGDPNDAGSCYQYE